MLERVGYAYDVLNDPELLEELVEALFQEDITRYQKNFHRRHHDLTPVDEEA